MAIEQTPAEPDLRNPRRSGRELNSLLWRLPLTQQRRGHRSLCPFLRRPHGPAVRSSSMESRSHSDYCRRVGTAAY